MLPLGWKSYVSISLLLLAKVPSTSAMFGELEICEPKAEICKGSKNVVLAPKRSFRNWANGCGTDSLGFQVVANDELDFTTCCNWHDACYGICGISKQLCERKFEKCMKDHCKTLHGENTEAAKSCESTADLYAMGPKYMGCKAFTAGQKEACDCVDASKADGKVRDRLKYVLKQYNADESADSLLDKYKGKEAVMFLRLLTKYPDALVVKKSKRESMFDAFKESLKKAPKEPKDNNDDVDEHIEL
ncbi:unnamed protein product [Aphanomyces euteiches]|uniref:Phospholipase A2 domain-containing protein n=1 Tax=Aphanomyces euteiches TaxID=100861 RepID=A0A6G0WHA4_9STRA|nr:hypothetical protein Ae201684_015173 [Aphanomyces euteiches]KAH9079959.1 hypothetical protein Ae201684P_020539 [Aphanomyces euteiches]KAH9100416.1 hypothetical protein LEN26_015859 [Aphanomyces euteiches]KAH9102471.1 hypothetical protein AeMF1_020924 [Aphanomyces euteiches]KAH9134418.1 hypothetical protein AeRB84_019758 [Aphanomyces euteiches]